MGDAERHERILGDQAEVRQLAAVDLHRDAATVLNEPGNVGKCRYLRVGVKGYNFPVTLRVEAEGRELASQKVGAKQWSDIRVDLQESAGKDVPVILELLVPEGQRWHEGGWIDYIDFFED